MTFAAETRQSHAIHLIDPGKWFGGGHVISEPHRSGHFEPSADLTPGEKFDEPRESERAGVAKVLDAVALTYVAALVSSLLTLLYYITAARGSRN